MFTTGFDIYAILLYVFLHDLTLLDIDFFSVAIKNAKDQNVLNILFKDFLLAGDCMSECTYVLSQVMKIRTPFRYNNLQRELFLRSAYEFVGRYMLHDYLLMFVIHPHIIILIESMFTVQEYVSLAKKLFL